MQFTGERWIPGKVERRIEEDHVERYLFATKFSPGMRVLDIACGVGAGSAMLATTGRAAMVHGVDLAAEAIDFARDQYRRENLNFEVAALEEYRPTCRFDLITCFETIEHVADEMVALRKLKAWLEPTGVLLVSSPNRPITSPASPLIHQEPANPFHVKEFTPGELKSRLLAAGFAGVQVYGQRLRWHSKSGSLTTLLNKVRSLCGFNPDRDSSAVVRRYFLRTPRYFVIRANG